MSKPPKANVRGNMAKANDVLDIVVIGAGWSGLLSCKYALDERLTVRVLEKREDIGGVWKFSPDHNITTVMKNSKTSSSSTVTEISDFPMPSHMGDFPKHWDIFDYLKNFSKKFNLRKYIHFNKTVRRMYKFNDIWNVETEDNEEYRARNVIVCSGVHQKANTALEDSLLRDFTGVVCHSGNLKEFDETHQNKKIMIIGGGETASDIMDEWFPNVQSILWCIPRGQHFFRKYSKLLPHRQPQALDKASSRALKLVAPHVKSKPGLAWICRWTTNGSILAYQGHGIPEFRNEAPFLHSFINKHAHALDYIDYEKVIPKGAIDIIDGKTVHFEDGSFHDVDVIIQCTGYEVSFPFLPEEKQLKPTDLYKFVFNPEDPSLAFVGFVRPIVGSIPGISEMNARWVCRTISGRVQLADKNDRMIALREDQKFWFDYFSNTSHRISTLVEGYTYLDDIAKLSGCYPDYWSLFKRNPSGALTAYFAPYNGCSYRLNEPDQEANALKTLRKHSNDTMTFYIPFFILLMRFIMFDWFCDILGTIKYNIQTNKTWHTVRRWRIVKLLDYVWCTPKRYLFDNVSR